MRRPIVITLAAVVGIGCQCAGGSGLSITVGFEGSASRCVAAGVQVERTGVFHATRAAARADEAPLIFGVGRTDTLKGKVIPFARGYATADCQSVDLEQFDEVAFGERIDLDAPGVGMVTLTLSGSASLDAGVDAGCDVVVDCANPACDTRPCAGDAGRCAVTLDGGRACLTPGPETRCGDRMDNDNDGQADCADVDCDAQHCDENACTPNDSCSGGVCEPGSEVSCPPNAALDCRATAGQCERDSGLCAYAPLDAGSLCDDGLLCTHGDLCGAVGDCGGTSYSCTSTGCATDAQCNGLGGCGFTFATSDTPCDDGNSCTSPDRCTDAGVCTGTGYACNPSVCFTNIACDADGGCLSTFLGVGSPCPGGACAGDGGCVRARDFGYLASNFVPDAIPDASIAPATFFSACTVEFDTTTNTSADGGWCDQVFPVPFVFIQDGGISTTVLPMAGFELAADSTLILTGSRPLILAVYGPAAIHGVIDARSPDGGRVGPGGNWSGCGLMNGGNAINSAGGGGAGFGSAGRRGGGAGAGDAGQAGTNPTLRPLTGGCRGGRGHDSSNRFEAPGGPGGGAVQISSSGSLLIDGTISASGGGGVGGTNVTVDYNGGGGGGSGGAILLEAMQLSLTSSAKLTCNGGAGGGGREDPAPGGAPGQPGSLATDVPALGGQGGSPPAGDGGHGAAGLSPPTVGVNGAGPNGSGGGGAGLGVIRLNGIAGCSIDAGALLSGSVTRSASCP